jgi:hypothetical protein
MSETELFSGPFHIMILYLLFGGPGLVAGAIIGALAWRKNRTRGAEIGAIIGFWMCIVAVWVWTVN